MHEKELCVKLVIYKDYHEYWVFQPAAQSPFRLSYTDSKQFSLEIKNCETRNNFLCSLIAYSLLSSRQYISILSSKLRKAANFGHTHIVTTHFCVVCSSGFQKQKRIYKVPNRFLLSLNYHPNKGFQNGDDYANSSTLVSKSTVPYVLCMAAEETLLTDAGKVERLVKIRYKNLTFRRP